MDVLADQEKYGFDGKHPTAYRDTEKHRDSVDDTGAVPGESFVAGGGLYGKLQRLAGRFGVEQRGIERVPEYERTDKSTSKVGTMVRMSSQTFVDGTTDL